ncbi:MAG: hypothetical protein M1831_001115 [Alyxoria varia]|nr:MAG: hypothetical protein M1831_001115 [Alyxoria varia]
MSSAAIQSQHKPRNFSRKFRLSALDPSSNSSIFKRRSLVSEDARRDSGMAHSTTTSGCETTLSVPAQIEAENASTTSIPAITVNDERCTESLDQKAEDEPQTTEDQTNDPADSDDEEQVFETPTQENEPTVDAVPPAQTFSGINTEIPRGSIDDPFVGKQLSFSKRGSALIDGKRAKSLMRPSTLREESGENTARATTAPEEPSPQPSLSQLAPSRSISAEEKRLSQRVRSLYAIGDDTLAALPEWPLSSSEEKGDRVDHCTETAGNGPDTNSLKPEANVDTASSISRSPSATSQRFGSVRMEPWEAAGGIEDWRDVNGADVDRYGFIKTRGKGEAKPSRSMQKLSETPEDPDEHQRPRSTASGGIEHVQETVSRPRKLQRPPPNSSKTNRIGSNGSASSPRPSSRGGTASVMSSRSMQSITPTIKSFRSASNPNKGRRWADEAKTMLTAELGRPESAASRVEDPPTSGAKARLERRREMKWAKMAKQAHEMPSGNSESKPIVGGGTSYTFDTGDAKVISRVWKGIPNRWRATAWHCFLTESARRQLGAHFEADDVLIERFHQLQGLDCPDDPQIDMDVPRTIGGHIMFRARYRGGQRLLFRVLHALALEFVTTGYVQGMAPLMATLLCFYDEERAFVMGVRMWRCRGLETLYSPGFGGLMDALAEFESEWLNPTPSGSSTSGASGTRAVAEHLAEMGIPPTSYGTKWYLTLFSYSLPFAAQLRVWDVFMLLGGVDHSSFVAAACANGTVLGAKKAHDASNNTTTTTTTTTNDTRSEDEKPDGKTSPDPSDAHIATSPPPPKPNLDALHAVSAALIDAMQPTLLSADFEDAMKALTAHVPVGGSAAAAASGGGSKGMEPKGRSGEDVLMRVARREWREVEERRRKSRAKK